MISFVEGTIEYRGDRFVIVNAGGVGYKVHIVPKTLDSLAKSEGKVKLFLHSQMNLREGTFDMYGFDTKEGLDLFNLLTSVQGIGSKNAMNILASIEARHLKAAVMNDDASYLKKISGLGPKTAQRLILELKNKVDHLDMGDMAGIDLGQESQALEALLALGYSQTQAHDALKEVKKTNNLHDRVKEALQILNKK
ncbi:MAG: Holliday junction branch migration protein RuvA [Patescibacteria group bacterium]